MRAMILAAGLGTRLRPLTLKIPKPLIEIAGKSLIEYQIENLVNAGIKELVINTAWLGDQLENRLGSGARWDITIHYSPEQEPLETAGGIRQALELLATVDDEPFLVVNGDLFVDGSYSALDLKLPAHISARLWLVENPNWHPHGDFTLGAIGLLSAEGEPKYTFSGVSLMRPSIFRDLFEGEKAPLAPILRAEIAKHRVEGRMLEGYWNDVGTHERLAAVKEFVNKGRAC